MVPSKVAAERLELAIADDRIQADPNTGLVVCDGTEAYLTPRQLRLYVALAETVDDFHTKEDITEELWQVDTPANRYSLHTGLNQLRAKFLSPDLKDPLAGAIRTRRSLGIAAVSSLSGDTYLWNEEKHDIIRPLKDELALNDTTRMLKVEGALVDVTPVEYSILKYLVDNQGLRVNTPSLMRQLRIQGSTTDVRGLMVNLSSLCKKLGPKLGDRKTGVIDHRRDRGYAFKEPLQ
jgi:DNA-binding response OmpR family regulator